MPTAPAGSANSMATSPAPWRLTEFQNLWLKARNQQMVREFQQFDRDGNGQVTLDEYKLPLSKFVAEMDRDNDKAVSDEELSPRRHWGKKMHGEMEPGRKSSQTLNKL